MTLFMIGYDLNRPGQEYGDLYETIKKQSNGAWWHHLDSTWIVESEQSAVAIRDAIQAVTDSNDKILVAKIGAPGAWSGFSSEGSDWLIQHL